MNKKEETTEILNNIINKFDMLVEIDILKFENDILKIKDHIVEHNEKIKSWYDEKFNNDKIIFLEKLNSYKELMREYEDNSYLRFKHD